jgi:hypothetical protein
VLIYNEDWHPKNGQGISFWLEPVRSEAAIDLYVYGEPIEFNSKYAQYFLKELTDNSIKKTLDEFKKSLTGGSLSLRKTVPLVKEDSINNSINKIKERISNFEGIIDKSIAEYRIAAKIT